MFFTKKNFLKIKKLLPKIKGFFEAAVCIEGLTRHVCSHFWKLRWVFDRRTIFILYPRQRSIR